MQENTHLVLAYYQFVDVANPTLEVEEQRKICQQHQILGRIYLSEQGINAQLSVPKEHADSYIQYVHTHPLFKEAFIKQQEYHEHTFAKLIVKYRKQLVALDAKPNMALRGENLSPKQWREMLETSNDYILLDVRNEYEWKVGRFEGAEKPNCDTFREFQDYAENLKKTVDPDNTPVMMYCTGGIRCEIFSSYLKEKGFQKIYQLEGGVIHYGQEEGNKLWEGKLFVFDDRMTVPLSEEPTKTIGKCHHCETPNDQYYNCANMDCNHLFLCCKACLEKYQGCCQDSCSKGPRIRPYHHLNPHKPFRKWFHYFQQKNKEIN